MVRKNLDLKSPIYRALRSTVESILASSDLILFSCFSLKPLTELHTPLATHSTLMVTVVPDNLRPIQLINLGNVS